MNIATHAFFWSPFAWNIFFQPLTFNLYVFLGLRWVSCSVQFSHSVVSDFLRPHGLQHTRPPCPSPTPSLLKLMSIESVMPSTHLILCHPLLLPPSILPSIQVFPNESVLCIKQPNYCGFSFSISPSNEYLGLISFRMDWFGSPCSSRDFQESSPTPLL